MIVLITYRYTVCTVINTEILGVNCAMVSTEWNNTIHCIYSD